MPVIVQSSFTNDGICGLKISASDPVIRSIHVALLMDTSGSMEGERIDAVKRTLSVLVDRLHTGDKITLVGFSTDAKVLLDSVQVTADNKPTLLAEVNKLSTDGGTNMEAGISGLGLLFQNGSKPNAVVLLTDGHVNEGLTSFAGLYSLITSYMPSIPVYTLGYGTDHNADLLKSLSMKSHANYSFIQDEISLPLCMGDMLGSLQTEVASSASISYDERWTCLEPMSEVAGLYEMGSLIADKPMWVLFKVPEQARDSVLTLNYKADGQGNTVAFSPVLGVLGELDIVEQHVRCLTGVTLNKVADAMQKNWLAEARTLLIAGIQYIALSAASSRPMVIRMKAQLDETLEEVDKAIAENSRMPRYYGAMTLEEVDKAIAENSRMPRYYGAMTPAALLLRTTSLGGNYSAQRGVTQMTHGTNLFSSPCQEAASQQMVEQYSQVAGDPSAHS